MLLQYLGGRRKIATIGGCLRHTVILDLTYRRRVKPLFLDEERVVVFTRHMEQDISPVKWK